MRPKKELVNDIGAGEKKTKQWYTDRPRALYNRGNIAL